MIYKTLEDLNITDTDFIADLMEDQNNWVPLYYAGKIRVPRPRMLIRLERCYGKWMAARAGTVPGSSSKRTKTAEAVITSQKVARDKAPVPVAPPAPAAPQKKKKLTEDDFAARKQDLIDRLAKMGVPEEKVEFEDPDEGAYKYIHGLTDEIGPVAGAIWRKNKPVFTGIGFKTCQREEDLQRLAPKTDYNSD